LKWTRANATLVESAHIIGLIETLIELSQPMEALFIVGCKRGF